MPEVPPVTNATLFLSFISISEVLSQSNRKPDRFLLIALLGPNNAPNHKTAELTKIVQHLAGK
jgi:hypothetical protein